MLIDSIFSFWMLDETKTRVSKCILAGFFYFAGIDMLFVRTALDLTENAVYSLHKTSTREVRTMGDKKVLVLYSCRLAFYSPQD